jgi:hypothetical protein
MNRYGALLMRQWKRADPQRFRAIPDPAAFFTEKGEELEAGIETLAQTLAGPDRPGETYLEKVARLASARQTAESDLVREAMIPEPEGDEEPLPPEWRPLRWTDPDEAFLQEDAES